MTATRDVGMLPPAPFDLAAERALLGGLLTEPEQLAQMALELSVDDFYRPEHGALFLLLAKMHAADEPVDLVTVGGRIQAEPGRYGGAGYVAELPEHCPSTANLAHYAQRIAERAYRRRLSQAAHRASLDALDDNRDPSEIAARFAVLSMERASPPASLIHLEEVLARPVRWCWRDRIPYGGITVIDGDPGLGKSTFCLDLLARASRGELEAGADEEPEPAVSLVLTTEDSLAYTIVPRLQAARAELSRIRAPTDVHTFPADASKLEAHVVATGARIVLLDPLVAYLGVDTHKDGEVRRALSPLAELASRHDVAILAIRHLAKAMDRPALYRGGGSIGIIGAARAGHIVGIDPKDPERRVFAPTKSNLGKRPQSLSWRLLSPLDPGGVCAVEHLGPSDLTADELMVPATAPSTHEEGVKLSEAEEWLRSTLTSGPQLSATLKRLASADGLAWMTVRRAKDRLGVKALKGAGGWSWSLGDP